MKQDRLIVDVAALLNSEGKNKIYRQRALDSITAFYKFFEENGLLKDIDIFGDDGKLKLDLIIRANNLTDDGLKMLQNGAEAKWSRYLTRSTVENKLEKTSTLAKVLAKIREKNS